jgi:hypothetical protein
MTRDTDFGCMSTSLLTERIGAAKLDERGLARARGLLRRADSMMSSYGMTRRDGLARLLRDYGQAASVIDNASRLAAGLGCSERLAREKLLALALS